jgi:hypothetical protein
MIILRNCANSLISLLFSNLMGSCRWSTIKTSLKLLYSRHHHQVSALARLGTPVSTKSVTCSGHPRTKILKFREIFIKPSCQASKMKHICSRWKIFGTCSSLRKFWRQTFNLKKFIGKLIPHKAPHPKKPQKTLQKSQKS